MEWKEIFKVSIINGLAIFILLFIVDFTAGFGDMAQTIFSVGAVMVGLLATGAILKRRLKQDWGIFLGLAITLLVALILYEIFSNILPIINLDFWVNVISPE